MTDWNLSLLKDSATIKESLIRINLFSSNQSLILFVLNDKRQVIGSLTDGDIRRGLLSGLGLSDSVIKVMNKQYHFLRKDSSVAEIRQMRSKELHVVPILDSSRRIIRFIDFKKTHSVLPLDAIIMAGGKGIRLRPYTNDIPKPMLELNGKPIIAHNIDRLITYGVRNFYISVNHLKHKIIRYLNRAYQGREISIRYIKGKKPLGTMGSVALVPKYEHSDLLVMNGDILTNINFEDFYVTYKTLNNDIAVATFNIKVDVPYAVLNTFKKRICSFVEKPTYVYYSNAGIYLFRKEHIKLIPKNKPYDAIDLVKGLIKHRKKATHFPIRGYWLDIGTLKSYRKAQDDINHIQF